MKRVLGLTAVAGLSIGLFGPGLEQARGAPARAVPAAADSPLNVALEYWRIWDAGGSTLAEAVSKQPDFGKPDWKPDAELSKELAEEGPTIDRLVAAANGPPADWGINRDEGLYAVLPHLGKLRGSARVLVADARRLRAAGDADGAAARVAAVVRMHRHTLSDKVLISSLVAQAIGTLGLDEARALAHEAALSPAGRRLLVDAVNEINAGDPFEVRNAVEGERTMFLGWMKARFTGPNGHAEMVKAVEVLHGGQMKDNAAANLLLGMDPAQVRADLDKSDEAYRDLLAAWDAPDATERLKAVQERVASGGYGVMATIAVPSVGKTHGKWTESVERVAAIKRELAIVPAKDK